MKQERVILLLVTVLVILSIVLMTGIGYAAETSNTLKISDYVPSTLRQTHFYVEFSKEVEYLGTGLANVKITGATTAIINVTGLEKAGDSISAILTIKNRSEDLYADFYAKTTNTNTDYFEVTATLSECKISPQNGEARLEINVKLIKTPIEKDENASIGIKIFASPIYSK